MKKKNYFAYLIDQFYKVLCLFEEKNLGLTTFIDSLSYEIYGLQYRVKNNESRVIIDSLLNILEHLYDDSLQAEYDLKVIKREIFHCTSLVEKMRDKEFGDQK
ncbi:hypothetical protein [Bacillus smithii]|uniref:hypothetical protein n=1 Tax=Bacillus smithii TaxID=1479 RepID=UPI003D1A1944